METRRSLTPPLRAESPKPGSQAPTSTTDRLPSLDGMRALGIIVVLMCHATDERVGPALRSLFPYFDGLAAVRVFFVISGFLITTLLVQEREKKGRVSLGRFYQRRFIRLFPVQFSYIVFLFILTLTTRLSISPCRFVTAITYLKNYGCAGKIDGHMWTLSVEEQFYLLWPLTIAFIPRKWCFIMAYAFMIVSPFSRIYEYKFEFPGGTNPIWWWLTSNSDVIMFGCVAGLIYKEPWLQRIIRYRPGVGRMVSLAMLIVPPILTDHLLLGFFTVTLGPTVQAVGSAYLVLSCVLVRHGVLYKLLNIPALVFIGLMSYSLYVWQEIFFFATPGDFGLRDLFIFHFPIDLFMAIVAGCLSYFGIERPLAGLRKALAERALRSNEMGAHGKTRSRSIGEDGDDHVLIPDERSTSTVSSH
jgi:peptidoglycan/LPS O-acetylase OafA/YrhL